MPRTMLLSYLKPPEPDLTHSHAQKTYITYCKGKTRSWRYHHTSGGYIIFMYEQAKCSHKVFEREDLPSLSESSSEKISHTPAERHI
jgi:hypothetical protein